MDKHAQLEIDVGAALAEADIVESHLELLAKQADRAGPQFAAFRKGSTVPTIIGGVLKSIKSVDFSPNDALAEMKRAREIVQSTLPHVLAALPHRKARSADQDQMLEHIAMLRSKIGVAIISITVRRTEPGQ